MWQVIAIGTIAYSAVYAEKTEMDEVGLLAEEYVGVQNTYLLLATLRQSVSVLK